MFIRKILLTEKSKILCQKQNVLTLSVSPDLNKFQIRKKMEELFPKIVIKSIKTCRYKPVLQKIRYSRGLPGKHYTSPMKKALVELMPESKEIINFLEGDLEESKVKEIKKELKTKKK